MAADKSLSGLGDLPSLCWELCGSIAPIRSPDPCAIRGRRRSVSRATPTMKKFSKASRTRQRTNDRLFAESRLAPGITARTRFRYSSYRIINAAFCHAAPKGSRFNSADRGAWYAAFEFATSQAEIVFHRQLWLPEIAWEEEDSADYLDFLADFRAEFHDLRPSSDETADYADCLSPDSYVASQAFAAQMLEVGSAGIVYPCVRRISGTCIACFRPVLVTNVRVGNYSASHLPIPAARRQFAGPLRPQRYASGERIFQRRALRREQFRAVLRDVHVVFEPHAELAANINSRLVAESHVGLQLGCVTAHQVRPLVAVHAHAVAEAVREVLVARAVAARPRSLCAPRHPPRRTPAPGRAAASAADCARCTMSKPASFCRWPCPARTCA